MTRIIVGGAVVIVLLLLGYGIATKLERAKQVQATLDQLKERNRTDAEVAKHNDDQLRRDINGVLGHR